MFRFLRDGRTIARAGLAAAAVAIAGLGFASSAAAGDVFVFSTTPVGPMSEPQVGTIPVSGTELGGDLVLQDQFVDPGGMPNREFFFLMSPYSVHGLDQDNGRQFTTLAFCIDFYTDLPFDPNLDWDVDVGTINHQYEDGAVPDYETEIFTLVNFGTDLWENELHDSALFVKLAAVQGAIWQLQTGKTFAFFPGWYDPAASQLIQDYANLDFDGYAVSTEAVRVILASDGQSQGLAYSLRTTVPEPATWGLMIGGFFVAGGMLRRARRQVRSAA